ARLAPHAHALNVPQSSGLRGWPLFTKPIIPCVNPAPLSAWSLVGIRIAYAQPFSSNCCCQFFSTGVPAGGGGNLKPGGNIKPNSMITGTGPFSFAGLVSVRSMFKGIVGQ